MITIIKGTAYLTELKEVKEGDYILSRSLNCAYKAEPIDVGSLMHVITKNSRKTGPAERRRRKLLNQQNDCNNRRDRLSSLPARV